LIPVTEERSQALQAQQAPSCKRLRLRIGGDAVEKSMPPAGEHLIELGRNIALAPAPEGNVKGKSIVICRLSHAAPDANIARLQNNQIAIFVHILVRPGFPKQVWPELTANQFRNHRNKWPLPLEITPYIGPH
jgi:hypothetical protein